METERFTVDLSEAAAADIISIADFTCMEYGATAESKLIDMFDRSLGSLVFFPLRAQAIFGFQPGLRRMRVERWNLFFIINHNTITVLRILDGRQDVEHHLGEGEF